MSQYQQRIGTDRRVHHRFEDLRASLVELGGNNHGIVLNISEGGMAILSAEDLDVNSLRNLRFQAPEFEHWMEIAAEIAWISDSRKQAGIRFKGLSETARTQLRAGISIATVRARRANESKQAGASAESLGEVTDSLPPFVAADPNSESESVSSEAHANSVQEEMDHQDGAWSHSEINEPPPDSRLPEEHREIETKEKAIASAESKPDSPTPPFDSPNTKLPNAKLPDTKPQKTFALVAGDTRSSPQKSALSEMRFSHLLAKSGVRLASYAYEGKNWPDISYGKWAAIAAIAIAASLLAFLAGWLLGDPSRIKLGH
jgi:hypothetical protein